MNMPKKTQKTIKKLRRPIEGRGIAGVCVGLADYFSIDVVIPRLLFVLTGIFGGGGVLAYIVCWLVIPEED